MYYLYQDERALPGNLQNRRHHSLSRPPHKRSISHYLPTFFLFSLSLQLWLSQLRAAIVRSDKLLAEVEGSLVTQSKGNAQAAP
jgi:hypothetical protein